MFDINSHKTSNKSINNISFKKNLKLQRSHDVTSNSSNKTINSLP